MKKSTKVFRTAFFAPLALRAHSGTLENTKSKLWSTSEHFGALKMHFRALKVHFSTDEYAKGRSGIKWFSLIEVRGFKRSEGTDTRFHD